jgi:hypothetical protein
MGGKTGLTHSPTTTLILHKPVELQTKACMGVETLRLMQLGIVDLVLLKKPLDHQCLIKLFIFVIPNQHFYTCRTRRESRFSGILEMGQLMSPKKGKN